MQYHLILVELQKRNILLYPVLMGRIRQGADIQLLNKGRRHVGHNGEAAPHVCVPANAVSDLIFLLYAKSEQPFIALSYQ